MTTRSTRSAKRPAARPAAAAPVEPTVPAPAKPAQLRRSVPPEIAAVVREEDQACAAAIASAKGILEATVAAANTQIASARSRHQAAMRPVLRQLQIDDEATIVETIGYGADTVIVVDLPSTERADG